MSVALNVAVGLREFAGARRWWLQAEGHCRRARGRWSPANLARQLRALCRESFGERARSAGVVGETGRGSGDPAAAAGSGSVCGDRYDDHGLQRKHGSWRTDGSRIGRAWTPTCERQCCRRRPDHGRPRVCSTGCSGIEEDPGSAPAAPRSSGRWGRFAIRNWWRRRSTW